VPLNFVAMFLALPMLTVPPFIVVLLSSWR
jgi:hypothetical protein